MDFSYEVSRSLAACQGVILLVDSAQVNSSKNKGSEMHDVHDTCINQGIEGWWQGF